MTSCVFVYMLCPPGRSRQDFWELVQWPKLGATLTAVYHICCNCSISGLLQRLAQCAKQIAQLLYLIVLAIAVSHKCCKELHIALLTFVAIPGYHICSKSCNCTLLYLTFGAKTCTLLCFMIAHVLLLAANGCSAPDAITMHNDDIAWIPTLLHLWLLWWWRWRWILER